MATRPARANVADALAVFTRDTAGRGNWGHTGLTKILKGVEVDEASWSPGGDTHSIWEEINHIIYWSRFTLGALEGGDKPMKQAWPASEGGVDGWRLTLGQAARLHVALVRRITALDQKTLSGRLGRTRYTNAQLILGCAAHIAYHTGQIALLRKLYRAPHGTGSTAGA
ncbi:MAG TPA: DinB family protein [Chloroflexota bacterium]